MTKTTRRLFLACGLVLGLALVLVACGSAATTTAPATPAPIPTCPALPTQAPCPTPAVQVIPFGDAWVASGHAKADAAAFTHWDTADPKEVPTTCAKCHTTPGYLDFLGADGSAPGVVDKAAPTGTVITCEACHNAAAVALTDVTFPSGAVVKGLGKEARCVVCHQGAASGVQVAAAIDKVKPADDDTPSKDLSFINVHYFAAGIARYGTLAKGGFEYPGKAYETAFNHTDGMTGCTDCHDQHSTTVKVEKCGQCHEGVKTLEDTRKIRWNASLVDYNGNGDVKEGIAAEIEGLQAMLMTAMQTYGKEVTKTAIVYSPDAYPYFFIDTNGNGQADADETKAANKYNAWTARLLKAAFNYQLSVKDPGAFAHGGKYVIELLYDSIDDLNSKLTTKVDLSKAHRTSAGHFDGSAMAFRDWDQTGMVPYTCAKCHSGMGLPTFINNGGNSVAQPAVNGLLCDTCHNPADQFKVFALKTVPFPSGAQLTFPDSPTSNICIECHQGRESTVSVNKAVAGKEADTVDPKLGFKNVHYLAAGATMFGGEAQGGYQYAGKQYVGRFTHTKGLDVCTGCHDPHALAPNTEACKGCHGTSDPTQIRAPEDKTDWDGDGNVTEGIAGEISTLQDELYKAIQAYAKDVSKKPIVYSAASYPYFFIDTNGNGTADPDELKSDNKFAAWTPRLLEAAYNYQYSIKDPGSFVHNGKYIIQLLVDSLQDLKSKDPAITFPNPTRPEVAKP